MKNFVLGLIVGICVTYYYVAGQDAVRDMVDDYWTRASSPPPNSPYSAKDPRQRRP